MHFSKTTGGFYLSGLHAIPDDAVEIDAASYAALLEGQALGKSITADADGFPVLADPQPLSLADQRAAMWCESWQLCRALTQKGWREDTEAAVAASSNQDLTDMWERAPIIRRMSPFVATVAAVLNKTDEDVDDLFILAASIK